MINQRSRSYFGNQKPMPQGGVGNSALPPGLGGVTGQPDLGQIPEQMIPAQPQIGASSVMPAAPEPIEPLPVDPMHGAYQPQPNMLPPGLSAPTQSQASPEPAQMQPQPMTIPQGTQGVVSEPMSRPVARTAAPVTGTRPQPRPNQQTRRAPNRIAQVMMQSMGRAGRPAGPRMIASASDLR